MRHDRLNMMERYIIEHRTVSLQELVEEFHVSLNTVRRDLNTLFERGNVYKVYGGVAVKESIALPPFHERAQYSQEEKACIGSLAASLVSDHSVIFLDAGSTVPHIIPHLAEREDLTIVTHSLSVMNEAAKYPKLQVVALGGYYNDTTRSYNRDSSILSDLQLKTAFMAASGISEMGIGCSNYQEHQTKKNVVSRSGQLILMADHTKFDKPVSFCYSTLDKLSIIVTDRLPSDHYMKIMESNDIQLLCPETCRK